MSSSFWKRSSDPKSPPPSSKQDRGGDVTNAFTILDLKTIVNSQKGKELDGHSPYSAFEYLVKRTQQDWKNHVISLVSNTSQELANLVIKLSEEVFGRFPNLRIQVRYLSDIMVSLLITIF